MKLRALGFCGADDSVHPRHLVVLAQAYPTVEFGVLFRPDKEGQPRYATTAWVQQLADMKPACMKLAAHLCGSRVNQVLEGDTQFIAQVAAWGFARVQINATAVNGVDTARLAEQVPNVKKIIQAFPQLEFIIQQNAETQPLWQGLLEEYKSDNTSIPTNLTMLVDESKGTGVTASSWPTPPAHYEIGYAGGIGPANVRTVLDDIAVVAADRAVWIDMESSLRSMKNNRDVFDLDKCFVVIQIVAEMGYFTHPKWQ